MLPLLVLLLLNPLLLLLLLNPLLLLKVSLLEILLLQVLASSAERALSRTHADVRWGCRLVPAIVECGGAGEVDAHY